MRWWISCPLLGLHVEKAVLFFRDLPPCSVRSPGVDRHGAAARSGCSCRSLPEGAGCRSGCPAPLLLVAVAIASCALLGLDRFGVRAGGSVPRALPRLSWPELNLSVLSWPGAAGTPVM